jgi:hypothetical protein
MHIVYVKKNNDEAELILWQSKLGTYLFIRVPSLTNNLHQYTE